MSSPPNRRRQSPTPGLGGKVRTGPDPDLERDLNRPNQAPCTKPDFNPFDALGLSPDIAQRDDVAAAARQACTHRTPVVLQRFPYTESLFPTLAEIIIAREYLVYNKTTWKTARKSWGWRQTMSWYPTLDPGHKDVFAPQLEGGGMLHPGGRGQGSIRRPTSATAADGPSAGTPDNPIDLSLEESGSKYSPKASTPPPREPPPKRRATRASASRPAAMQDPPAAGPSSTSSSGKASSGAGRAAGGSGVPPPPASRAPPSPRPRAPENRSSAQRQRPI